MYKFCSTLTLLLCCRFCGVHSD